VELRSARFLRLCVCGPELLDLRSKLVSLFGGRPYDREPLERVSQRLLEPVALRRELVLLAGVPLLLLVEAPLLLGRGGLRLGERHTQAVELGPVVLVLSAQVAELLLVRRLRRFEGALQPADISQQPLDLGPQLIALFRGRAFSCESLESVFELVVEPVALRGELASLAGVPLPLLGQPALLLRGCCLRLGEHCLQLTELVRRAFVLLSQAREFLFALGLRFGEGRLEALELVRGALVLLS
jgi:hypothetical protein